MIARGFIKKPKLIIKASRWIQLKDCCNSTGGLVLNIWVKTKQLQTKEVRIPAIAMRELDVLSRKEKRVIRMHATSGAKKVIQIK